MWVRVTPAMRVVLLVVSFALVGCSDEAASTSASESPSAEAFYAAHGRTPEGALKVDPVSPADLVGLIQADLQPDVPVLLPGTLPFGYERAAPFRGTGSGAALPNPHVWGSGYAVTYTDGFGRLTMVVNSDDELTAGDWEPAPTTLGQRRLEIQQRDALVLVRTVPDGDIPIAVVGENVSAETVLGVAKSLEAVAGPSG